MWFVDTQLTPPSDKGTTQLPMPTIQASWESQDLNVIFNFWKSRWDKATLSREGRIERFLNSDWWERQKVSTVSPSMQTFCGGGLIGVKYDGGSVCTWIWLDLYLNSIKHFQYCRAESIPKLPDQPSSPAPTHHASPCNILLLHLCPGGHRRQWRCAGRELSRWCSSGLYPQALLREEN